MHSVALEKAFQNMYLDLSCVTSQILTKSKVNISLCFFLKISILIIIGVYKLRLGANKYNNSLLMLQLYYWKGHTFTSSLSLTGTKSPLHVSPHSSGGHHSRPG